MAGLEMQPVYNVLFMSSFEKKVRFLGKFYLRLNEKTKHWLLGSLGRGLLVEKWGWERLPQSTRASHPHSWPLEEKKAGLILGTDQHLLALHSNYTQCLAGAQQDRNESPLPPHPRPNLVPHSESGGCPDGHGMGKIPVGEHLLRRHRTGSCISGESWLAIL